MEKCAVALLSGGLDSTAALRLARKDGWTIIEALTFDYGQRAASRELAQAKQICERWQIPHRGIALPWFSQMTTHCSLLGASDIPHLEPHELGDMVRCEQTKKSVWVPNRNGVLLSIAAALAEALEAQAIVVGFNREEALTFPDNSHSFLTAFNHSLSYSTENRVQVISPTIDMNKTEIIKTLDDAFPFDLIWSCYEGNETMCGRCESCQRLKRAFAQNELSYAHRFAI